MISISRLRLYNNATHSVIQYVRGDILLTCDWLINLLWKGKPFLSTSGTCPVTLVANLVISHEWRKDGIMSTTNWKSPWSFVSQIWRNGWPSHGGDCKTSKVLTSTWPIGTLSSVAFLVVATSLYQWNHDRNHKLWNIVLIERYSVLLNIQRAVFQLYSGRGGTN